MKKAVIVLLSAAVLTAVLWDFFAPPKEFAELFLMDTVIKLEISGKEADEALKASKAELKRIDAELNVNGSGALYRFNEGEAGTDEIKKLKKRSACVSEETDGAFDATVRPLIKLWGFTEEEKRVPSEEEIHTALSQTGYKKDNVQLDFGAVAKGYAADRIKEILDNYKINGAVISIGGTVVSYCKKSDIAIESPKGQGYAAVITCENTVLSTSGGYERYFTADGKKYSHIIDPLTGYPAESGIASVTVISEDGFLSDALSTAFYVMGEDKAKSYLKEHSKTEVVLITDDGRIIASNGVKIKEYDKNYILERID